MTPVAGVRTSGKLGAFRKPFAAATFGAVEGWHFAVDYKIALVLAQVAGYAASKLIGVKVISEIAPRHRGLAILGLIGVSWLALVAFALVPAPWNVAALFVNGLPLGMIWGLVFGYMEGLVRDNLRALLVMHGVILAGFVMLGLSTLAFQAHLLTPLAWMILSGAGLYMAYTPFNAMLFDRMIAFSGQVGTAGFLIYVADASGYLGSVALLVWRNFALVTLDWLGFFIASIYATSLIGATCAILAGVYFFRRHWATRGALATAGVVEDALA